MTNYLLTVIGVFESEEDCKDIALAISPIVDSPNLNFQYSKGVMLYHFASEAGNFELFDYITGILFGVTDTFILTEMSDKVLVSFPEKIRNTLFNLNSQVENLDMRLDMSRVKKNLDFLENSDEEIDDSFIAQFWENIKEKIKTPSLDQILDKICCDGVNSLTPLEKETLETYSKN